MFIFLLLISLQSFGSDQSLDEYWGYLQLLEDKIGELKNTCYRENQFLNSYEFSSVLPDGEKALFNCHQFQDFLVKEIVQLQADVETYYQKAYGIEKVCSNNTTHLPINSLEDLSKIQIALKEKMQNECVDVNRDLLSCAKDQLCNLNSSLFSFFEPFANSLGTSTTTYNKATQTWETKANVSLRKVLNKDSCGYRAVGESDCFTSIGQGIFKNIVVMYDTAKSLGYFIIFGEDRMSNILHILREFKHPWDFAMSIGRGFFNMVSDAVKYHFGCDQWEGENFFNRGKCLKPARSWECMNCNQQLNVMCGVMGFVLGNPLSSYIMGRIYGIKSGGMDSAKIASPQVKKIFDAIGRGKEWVQAQKSTHYLKSKMQSVVPTALKKIPSSKILQKYRTADYGAFEDGFKAGKHSTLKFGYKLGTQGYREAYFLNKMTQHRLEVSGMGQAYILEQYKDIPGIDAKQLADDYVKYIDKIHDVDKFSDPIVRAGLAKGYTKKLPQHGGVVSRLNELENAKRELFIKHGGVSTANLKIIEEVEKYADQVSRYLGSREIWEFVVDPVSGKGVAQPARFSDEFGRKMYSPKIDDGTLWMMKWHDGIFPSEVLF